MQTLRRALALLLCLCMVMSYVDIPHAHAAEVSNITLTVDKETVNVGDTVTVTIRNNLMNVIGFGVFLEFDQTLLTCTFIDGFYNEGDGYLGLVKTSGRVKDVEATAADTVDATNSDGIFSFGVLGTVDTEFTDGIVATLTFTATAAGTVTFTLNEDTAGIDSFRGVAATATVTIGGSSEPECEHKTTETNYTYGDQNGWHKYYVVCTDCGETIVNMTSEECSGGTASCDGPATCEKCGMNYGSEYHANAIHKTAKDPTCADDGWIEHWYCPDCCVYGSDANFTSWLDETEVIIPATNEHKSDAEHACEDGFCEYCGEPVAATENHTPGEPVKNTEESTDATCTEGGTLVEDIFCTECGEFIKSNSTPVAATCTTGTVDYSWAADYSTGTAKLICEHGTVLKEETVTTTSSTTEGNCTTPEVVTYYADFQNFEDKSIPVTGEKNPAVHTNDGNSGYYKDNGDGTHSFICGPCGQPVEGKTGEHDKDNCVFVGNCVKKAEYLCSKCNFHQYGEVKPDTHAAESSIYVQNEDGATHTVKWPCCDAVVNAAEPHNYVDGRCACDAVEHVHTHYDYIRTATTHQSSCYCHVTIGDPIPHEAKEDGYCVCGWFELIVDFNGGKITTTAPEGMTDEEWAEVVEAEFGGFEATQLRIFGIGMSNIDFDGLSVKEGFMYAGLAYDAEGTQPYNGEEITEPTTLYFIWESTHVCAHDHYDITATTHQSVCSCDKSIGEEMPHEAGEDGYCVCGAFEFVQDLNGGKITETSPDPEMDDDEWKAMVEELFGGFDVESITTFATVDGEFDLQIPIEPEYIDALNLQFVREGYKIVALAYDAEGTDLYEGEVITGPCTIYLVWDCTHDETVYEYSYADNGDGTHTLKCACGEPVGEAEAHDYTYDTANHKCICGELKKFEVTMNFNGGIYGVDLDLTEYKFSFEYTYLGWAREVIKGWYDNIIREGYTIKGWTYVKDDPSTLIDIDTFDVTDDTTTLYALWETNEYILTVRVLATDEHVDLEVPYGANVLEVLAQAAEDGKIPAIYDQIPMNVNWFNGLVRTSAYSYLDEDSEEWIYDLEGLTMPDADFVVDQDYELYHGWILHFNEKNEYVGAMFTSEGSYLTGWNYIEEDYDDVEGGAWYYFDDETSFRTEGLTRVPYPTEEIGGNTYAPDADALAYDPNFIDAAEAWFLFDEDGKFQSDFTGYEWMPLEEGPSWVVNGMIPWHYGMVEIDGEYNYFIGNEEKGGNMLATGDVYVKRNTTDRAFVIDGIYTFDVYGVLCEYDGIIDMDNGTKRYYEDAQLMIGNGLTKVGENFIYVRSNGELVVDAKYYVPAGNAYNVVSGHYDFDENGFMVDPVISEKDGIVAENGGLYFYENGKIAYNKGLIAYNGGVIYVRSNGQLAVGEYYITNVANYTGTEYKTGDKLTFGADGYLAAAKNGIVDGYFYKDNKIVYGAGVVEIEEGKYIYVKSNGTVVMNTNYWITNVGDTGVVAKLYTFDENGYFTPEFAVDAKDGIVEVDGVLYYYENGAIAYGKGIVKLTDENGVDFYIYVRSNGQLATGIYWPTTTNGYDFSGRYDFGTDGKLYI